MNFSYLEIKRHRSTSFFVFLLAVYLMALSVLCIIRISFTVQSLLAIVVILQGYQACWGSTFLKKERSIVEIVFNRGEWRTFSHEGEERVVELMGDSYQSSWLIILYFREIEQKKQTIVILPRDSVNQDTFRRLRVVLGYGKLLY